MPKALKIIEYLAVSAVAILALLLIASTFPLPRNYKILVVQSGSMEPTLKVGGLIISKPAQTYQTGDIITFQEADDPNELTTHRIVEKNPTGFITKGDANEESDKNTISQEDTLGKVLFALPYLGYAVSATKTPIGFIALIIFPATMIIYDEIRKIKDEVVKIRQKKALTLLVFACAGLISLNYTKAYFSDIEQSTGNILQATTWDTWMQTTKDDFEAGNLENVDTTTFPDSVTLTGAYPIDENTVGLWHLNEGSGTTAYDETANGNNGTINGASWISAKYSYGLEFDGNDYVSVANNDVFDFGSGEFTVEAWVKTESSNREWIASRYQYYGPGWGLGIQNSHILGYIRTAESGSGKREIEGTTNIADNAWHHIALKRVGNDIEVWVDNSSEGSAALAGNVNNNEPVEFGRISYNGGSGYFNGTIDEIRISNIARPDFPVSYFDSGYIESQVFDAGEDKTRDWSKLEWDEDTTAAGTDITLEVATSSNCSDWSTWQLASNDAISGIDLSSLSNSRCFKWKATLTTTNPDSTPILEEVRVLHFAP